MSNIRWVQLDGRWHLIEKTWIYGTGWLVLTHCCDITRSWDQTFLDRLPGGGEVVCDRVGGEIEPDLAVATPKKTRKAKISK